MKNQLTNKEIYQKYYNFELFTKLFEDGFDKRIGQSCERLYDNLIEKDIRLSNFYTRCFNIIDYITKLGGEILPKKAKYEALRFKINSDIHIVYYRFRAGTHYRIYGDDSINLFEEVSHDL